MSAQMISCRLNRFYAFLRNDMSSEVISCLLNVMFFLKQFYIRVSKKRPFFLLSQSKYVGEKVAQDLGWAYRGRKNLYNVYVCEMQVKKDKRHRPR